ncbi:MAG: YhcH/YjgK/YiaL family protein [Clostridium sp.]|nr:YhcH/YjgK/YiaL family protein [Clostridium sp.]
MIIDNIQNIHNYKSFSIIYGILEELAKFNIEDMPNSTIVYEEDKIFANQISLTSKPEYECMFEAHKKYIDVHYILEGIEGISTSSINKLEVQTPYNNEKDIAFYNGDADGTYYLNPGDFMICWPNDAHKVAIMKNSPSKIKKIVCKISIDYL